MTVELFGMARAIVGAASVDLPLPEPTDARRLIAALASAYPALLGAVIEPSGERLVAPNLLLLDGRRAIGDDAPIGGDDKPCVLFLASGG